MFWNHVEVCSVFCSAATRKNICYQTIGKAISAGFKTQNFQAHFQALSGKGMRSFKIFSCLLYTILRLLQFLMKSLIRGGGGRDEVWDREHCSHNFQSGHPAWWSADNYSIFPTVNIFRSKKRTGRGNQKSCLKNWKKSYHASLFFLHVVFVFRYWNVGETKMQPC